jgi:hypothetical protein
MELTREQKDADFWERAKSSCCQKALKHHVGIMNNKPYQSWICTKCGTGWNNTKTDKWNYNKQKITIKN